MDTLKMAIAINFLHLFSPPGPADWIQPIDSCNTENGVSYPYRNEHSVKNWTKKEKKKKKSVRNVIRFIDDRTTCDIPHAKHIAHLPFYTFIRSVSSVFIFFRSFLVQWSLACLHFSIQHTKQRNATTMIAWCDSRTTWNAKNARNLWQSEMKQRQRWRAVTSKITHRREKNSFGFRQHQNNSSENVMINIILMMLKNEKLCKKEIKIAYELGSDSNRFSSSKRRNRTISGDWKRCECWNERKIATYI